MRGEICGRHQSHAPLTEVRLIVEFFFLSIPPLHYTRAVTLCSHNRTIEEPDEEGHNLEMAKPGTTSFWQAKKKCSPVHMSWLPYSGKPTELIVDASPTSLDASPTGLGAILTQNGKVICCASRALTPTEQRYSQTDREFLAVVFICTYFVHFSG